MPFPDDPLDKTPPDKAPLEGTHLLKSVLPPLLEDFQHWFGRSIELLETQEIGFLLPTQKQDLLARVKAAQRQISASQALPYATDSQVGIEMPVVMAWHKLLHECWGVALRYRQDNQTNQADPGPINPYPPSP